MTTTPRLPPPTFRQLGELLREAEQRTVPAELYDGITYEQLARACGVDARTWRRWRESPPTVGLERIHHVAALLRGWLALTEHAMQGPGGVRLFVDAERLRRWRADPSRLALSCLAALHPQEQQLDLAV